MKEIRHNECKSKSPVVDIGLARSRWIETFGEWQKLLVESGTTSRIQEVANFGMRLVRALRVHALWTCDFFLSTMSDHISQDPSGSLPPSFNLNLHQPAPQPDSSNSTFSGFSFNGDFSPVTDSFSSGDLASRSQSPHYPMPSVHSNHPSSSFLHHNHPRHLSAHTSDSSESAFANRTYQNRLETTILQLSSQVSKLNESLDKLHKRLDVVEHRCVRWLYDLNS